MNRISKTARTMARPARALLRRHFPHVTLYEGSRGTTWLAGVEPRAPSIAGFFSGEDVRSGPRRRMRRQQIPDKILEIADGGGLPILRLVESDPRLADILQYAIAAPVLVDIHKDLPADPDTLRAELLTSTTREDFRRIRRADFTYRVTDDPDAMREFHTRHYIPLVTQQFPEDGRIGSVDKLLTQGELVCADIDGEWVAGIYNVARETSYALTGLGIRDADDSVRQKRVAAALIIRSLERAVELGYHRATLGHSLPFLGKGPVWFKMKWGSGVTHELGMRQMHMFMDLRHDAVRQMLSETPVIHAEGDELVVSSWLEPGDEPRQVMTREAGRYPGISRWYVLGEQKTLDEAAAQLAEVERVIPLPVTLPATGRLWLSEALSGAKLAVRR
jgi:hypothetical protein